MSETLLQEALNAPAEEPIVYDSIEIEDMTYDPITQAFYYPCPCGDQFQVAFDDLADGENIATCPSCSLMIEVIFEPEDLEQFKDQ